MMFISNLVESPAKRSKFGQNSTSSQLQFAVTSLYAKESALRWQQLQPKGAGGSQLWRQSQREFLERGDALCRLVDLSNQSNWHGGFNHLQSQ